MGLFKKLTGLGASPEEKEREKNERAILETLRHNEEFEGKKIGVQRAARAKGISEGRKQALNSGRGAGLLGAMSATIEGLNRAEKNMGFSDMFNQAPAGYGPELGPGPSRKRKKQRNPFFDF